MEAGNLKVVHGLNGFFGFLKRLPQSKVVDRCSSCFLKVEVVH